MTDRARIAFGECVSPTTVDRCPYCVDSCKASAAKRRIRELLDGTRVDKPKEDLK